VARAAARPRRLLQPWVWLILCGSAALGGCSLLPGLDRDQVSANRPLLPQMQTGKGTIQLELIFVERSPSDPLLGPALWREVDQVGALPANTRSTLERNGFRIGHVSSNPPEALQTLLGMVSEIADEDADSQNLLKGRRLVIQSGKETEVQTSSPLETCTIKLPEDEETERTFDNARCVFRVRTFRLQDGWVRVDFLPEVHHGESVLRRQAAETGWFLKGGQQVLPREAQKFSITLGVGEFAVITAGEGVDDTLGDWFFRTRDGDTKRQRLLVVRLADMSRADPIYQPKSGARPSRIKHDPIELVPQ
jgi:hypothetical protein